MPKGYSANHDNSITIVRLGSGDVISPDEIVSSNPIHVKSKEYLDSPEEGLEKLRQIYSNSEKLTNRDINVIAVWAAYFGDFDFAMDILEKTGGVSYFWHPVMEQLRKTPRFKEFVREIGLVDYWKEFGWPDLCRPIGDDDFVCD